MATSSNISDATEIENEASEEPFYRSHWIRGYSISAVLEPKFMEMAMDFLPSDGDIIITSYVKTGSTFLQYAVWSILHPSDPLPAFTEMKRLAPELYLMEPEQLQFVKPPRIMKHHLPYDAMQINKNAKYIYIYRSPCDVIASYYHFFAVLVEKPKSVDDFFHRFLEGDVPFGNYFDHVLAYYKHRREPHVLLISYEKLLEDKEAQVLKISQFLGNEYYNRIFENNDLMDKILKQTEINYMKKNIDKSFDITVPELPHIKEVSFLFRKGIIGDGKTFLTSKQIESLKNKIKLKMEGTDILEEWLTRLL